MIRGFQFVGKSTVARIFGELFRELGLLGIGTVIETSGPDLIGTHVGDAKTRFLSLLDRALGSVLFIDEAYDLVMHGSREVIDMLLQKLTEPKYQGKVVVILAGYEREMKTLFSSNPGLRGRFQKQLALNDFAPEFCWKKAVKFATERYNTEIPSELRENVLRGFVTLMNHESFQNARDVEAIVDCAIRSRDVRTFSENEDSDAYDPYSPISKDDLDMAFQSLTEQRPRLSGASLRISNPDELPPLGPIRRGISRDTSRGSQSNGEKTSRHAFKSDFAPATNPPILVEAKLESKGCKPFPVSAGGGKEDVVLIKEESEDEEEEVEELDEYIALDIIWEYVESAFKGRGLDHNAILEAMESENENVLPNQLFDDVLASSKLDKETLKKKLEKERAQVAKNIRKAIEEAMSQKPTKCTSYFTIAMSHIYHELSFF